MATITGVDVIDVRFPTSLTADGSDAMNKDAVFVTYSASSKLKRDLAGLGLSLDSVPGPPGKKEMTRAWKL